MLPGNLTVLLGNREHLFKESLHLGARARALARARGHHGQPIGQIQRKFRFNRDGWVKNL